MGEVNHVAVVCPMMRQKRFPLSDGVLLATVCSRCAICARRSTKCCALGRLIPVGRRSQRSRTVTASLKRLVTSFWVVACLSLRCKLPQYVSNCWYCSVVSETVFGWLSFIPHASVVTWINASFFAARFNGNNEMVMSMLVASIVMILFFSCTLLPPLINSSWLGY